MLEKSVWTNDDFEIMSWNCSKLYCFTIEVENYEFIFDIDYIMKWIPPKHSHEYYNFLVSPATLVFHGIQNVEIDIGMDSLTEIKILNIRRECIPRKILDFRWSIELIAGDIVFDAYGFSLYCRKKPVLNSHPNLELKQRGGYCLEKISW